MKRLRYIKEYSSYISKNKKLEDFETNGQFIEYLYNLNDDYKAIIKEFTSEYDPTIRIANVIDNMMPIGISNDLVSKLSKQHECGDDNDLYESAKPGRNIFVSFLRVVAAMGGKNNTNVTVDTPDDYILYYIVDNIDSEKFKSIIENRFKSMKSFIDFSGDSETCIYFGLKLNNRFEYGIVTGNNHNQIGEFGFTESTKKWILNLSSSAAAALKYDLIENDVRQLKLLSKIKQTMISLTNEMGMERNGIYLKDDILVVPYINLGTWSNGQITQNSISELKLSLNQALLKYKWSDSVLTSLQPSNYSINFFIKLK